MTIRNLHDLYIHQLKDLHSAATQSLDATTKLGRMADDKRVSEALIDGANGISSGIETLKTLCAEHDVDPKGETCRAMEGLVREAMTHTEEDAIADPATRDAMIIAQYQRMVHYALAGYGCLRTFANRLGYDEDAGRLQKMLDDTYDGDRRMTKIAIEGGVNRDAA